jgi:phosphate/sulfate permease
LTLLETTEELSARTIGRPKDSHHYVIGAMALATAALCGETAGHILGNNHPQIDDLGAVLIAVSCLAVVLTSLYLVSYVHRRQMARNQRLLLREITAVRAEAATSLGRVEALLEQITAKLPSYWQGYTDGAQDTTGMKVVPIERRR